MFFLSMKNKIIFATIIASLLYANLFAGWSNGSIHDNHGNQYNFRTYHTNDLIEYDQYKRQQDGAAALGYLIGLGIGKGIEKITIAHRDRLLAEILRGYKFEKHNQYMSAIAESNRLKAKCKSPLISLVTAYKKYRETLDNNYLNQIHTIASKPKIQYFENNLDLSETPYVCNAQIEKWVHKNYPILEKRNCIKELIYEYKYNRLEADKELDNIYFAILKK